LRRRLRPNRGCQTKEKRSKVEKFHRLTIQVAGVEMFPEKMLVSREAAGMMTIDKSQIVLFLEFNSRPTEETVIFKFGPWRTH
jgi:hypothetical protein